MANTKKKKDNKEYKYIECECKTHKGRKLLREDNFYTSKSPLFTDGKVHICKKLKFIIKLQQSFIILPFSR